MHSQLLSSIVNALLWLIENEIDILLDVYPGLFHKTLFSAEI